jgi:isohexenylglutaconyl-CoA hydratase
MAATFKHLWVTELRGAVFVTLNQPATRNALSHEMVLELAQVLDALPDNKNARALVLRGSNGFFCAGGSMGSFEDGMSGGASGIKAHDVKSQQGSIAKSNRQFGFLMQKLANCPVPVIAAVEGAAMGGGLGLAAVSDVVLATSDAKFALTETMLGLIPAQIAPFVVARLGVAKTRRLGLTGERLNGEQALNLGLVDALASSSAELDERLAAWLSSIGRCAPGANRTLKHMLGALDSTPQSQWLDEAAQLFSQCMVSPSLTAPEGAEGVAAFRAKRPAKWVTSWTADDVRAQLPPPLTTQPTP